MAENDKRAGVNIQAGAPEKLHSDAARVEAVSETLKPVVKANPMATNPNEDRARKVLDEDKKRRESGMAEYDKRVQESRPTPTQEENDLAKLGVDVVDKEPDGSPTEEEADDIRIKEMQARASYKTRAAQAQPAQPAQPARKPE